MSRPDIADYLGLTIESNLVSTEISGSLRRNRSAELAAHCAAQLLRTEHLTSRAHAGIGQTSGITTTQIPMVDRSHLSGLCGQNGASERPPAAAITRPDGQRRSSCDTAIKTLDLGQGPRVNLDKNKFFGL
jgi:hypothetical protein